MRRAAFAGPAAHRDHAAPMGDLNITPLIDVMLVLLVMFILLLPAATHKVPIELPPPGPNPETPVVTHRLALERSGQASLDGTALSDAALGVRLRALAGEEGALVMHTDPEARYERFDQLLATVKRAGVTRLGFAHEGDPAKAF